jgi:hypothetical protein
MSGSDRLAEWAAARGLELEDFTAAGFTCRNGYAACEYLHADGRTAERRLYPSDVRPWRWATGDEGKGAVLVLGDAHRAGLVLITEGESDGLRAWRVLGGEPAVAVIVLPGSGMVPELLANFIGNGALVVLGTDADPPGDRCAELCCDVLMSAGVSPSLIRRLRPDVPGLERPDLRDLLEHLDD